MKRGASSVHLMINRNHSVTPKLLWLCLLAWGLPILLPAQSKPKKSFKLPAVLQEVSGLYYAGPDSLWWLNDSGDKPRLFLTNGQGQIKKEVLLPLQNRDWEDLTADDEGTIYIGEFGNNQSLRNDLKIYTYHVATEKVDSIEYNYPDQVRFDQRTSYDYSFNMEGFFWHQDSLHLFSKCALPKSNYLTKHYVLTDKPGTQTAILRDSLVLKKRAVTAAAIHAETGRVALLAYYYNKILGFWPVSRASVFFFDDYPEGYFLRGKQWKKRASFLIATQYESLDFLPDHYFYIASEQTRWIKPRVKRMRIPKRYRRQVKP
ncbi:MAG: hypothetical protein HRU41_40275 [Saprospiraceae bacterium]|nr:hypothetical protein [Saprospiraceae bacterium]